MTGSFLKIIKMEKVMLFYLVTVLAYIDMRNIILFLKVIGKVDILKKTC
ncbi:MAG: hypothetical protein JG775_1221 [Defluviitaleaceae bacterium]|jgi:hypothetical protein|nr:hypothetical protein [Defluviitaleaceae bacterium]